MTKLDPSPSGASAANARSATTAAPRQPEGGQAAPTPADAAPLDALREGLESLLDQVAPNDGTACALCGDKGDPNCCLHVAAARAALASAEGASAAPQDEMREPPEYEKLLSELEKEKAAHANATEHMGAAIAREKALRRPLERLIEVAQRQWDEKPAKASDLNRINEAREALNTSLMLRPPTEDEPAAAPLGAPDARPEVLAERERCARLASSATTDPESRMIHPDIPFGEFGEAARFSAHATAQAIAAAIRDGTK